MNRRDASNCAVRRSDARNLTHGARAANRRDRIDRVEAGKSQLWKFNLRISELVNFCALVPSVVLLWSQAWSFWALAPACLIAVGGMWAFARRMRPREERLCRHMVFLARHRRRCAMCRYCIQGLAGPVCPECGFAFDVDDDRHLMIPLINQMYSRQGRQVAAVSIAAGLAAVVLLAQGADWRWHVGWSLALLATLHGLFGYWVIEARSQQRAFERAGVRPYRDRPDPRRPADPRLLSLQYFGILLRWGMMSAICGGLAVIVNLDSTALRFLSFGGGANMLVVSLGIPVLAYVLGVGLVMRACISRLMSRVRIRLADVESAKQ